MGKFGFVLLSAILLAALHIVTCGFQGVRLGEMWTWFIWGYTGSGLYAGFSTLGNVFGVLILYAISGAALSFKKPSLTREAKPVDVRGGTLKKSVSRASGGCLFLFAFWLLGVVFCAGSLDPKSGALFAIAAYVSASIGLGLIGYLLLNRGSQ